MANKASAPRRPVQRLGSLSRLASSTTPLSKYRIPISTQKQPLNLLQQAQKLKAIQAPPSKCCDDPDIQVVGETRSCLNCGEVAQEAEIVSEITFGETSGGAAFVQGGFVGEDQRHAGTMGGDMPGMGSNMTSRELTEWNGRATVRNIVHSLNLGERIEQQAWAVYKLALNLNFIQGRRVRHVAAACIYMTCRRQKGNTLLLMDLAEKLQVNVWKLGDVYKALLSELLIDQGPGELTSIEQLDIEPLVLKFCQKLEFGEDSYKVARYAAKILKRMNRDWMVTGRQPAGICGACIILAARLFGYRRTIREVVYVVKVADATVATRLVEFQRTEASRLSVRDFEQYADRLKVKTVPPAIYKRQEREEKLKRIRGMNENQVVVRDDDDSERSVTPEHGRPVQLLEEGPQIAKKRKTTVSDSQATAVVHNVATASPAAVGPALRDQDGFLVPTVPASSASRPPDPTITQALLPADDERQLDLLAAEERPINDPEPDSLPKPLEKPKRSRTKKKEPIVVTPADLEIEAALEQEITNVMKDWDSIMSDPEHPYHKELEVKAQHILSTVLPNGQKEYGEEVEEDEFANDPEVTNCLLSPAEVLIKERIWMTQNEQWLREQQKKTLDKALEEARGGGKKKKSRPRKTHRVGDGSVLGNVPAASAAEAVQRMRDKQKRNNFSSHINYERLVEIYGTPKSNKTSEAGSENGDGEGRHGSGMPTPPNTAGDEEEEVIIEEDDDGHGAPQQGAYEYDEVGEGDYEDEEGLGFDDDNLIDDY